VNARDVLLLFSGTVLPSLLTAGAAGFAVRRWGPQFGLVDRPGHRKVHEHPMPTAGGLAIWLGLVAPFAVGQVLLGLLPEAHHLPASGGLSALVPELVRPHLPGLWERSGRLWIMLGGGTVLLVLGLIDDRRGLDWRVRMAVQTLVAIVTVALGWRMTLFLDWPWLTAAFSVLWIVGLVNSFNMLDNMDGLSAGVAAIAAAMLAAVVLLAPLPTTHAPQLFIGGFMLVLLGSLLGFLGHNRPPARLFMGDTGSYLIGYLLATISLGATFSGGPLPRYAILAPLFVLAVPLYDTASVILIRLREGRSPFVGDKSHFSHRLVELGMSRPQAVATVYLVTATCGLGAFLLHEVDAIGAAVVVLLVVLTLALVAILEAAGRRRNASPEPPPETKERDAR
jgi:UDP-GlcNAc:undecaprenyl-phosphate/decaprenyl-phosphate GlcNAc-1-phosphate transferase